MGISAFFLDSLTEPCQLPYMGTCPTSNYRRRLIYCTLASNPSMFGPGHQSPTTPDSQSHIDCGGLWHDPPGTSSCRRSPVPHTAVREQEAFIGRLNNYESGRIYHYENHHPGKIQRLHNLHGHRGLAGAGAACDADDTQIRPWWRVASVCRRRVYRGD